MISKYPPSCIPNDAGTMIIAHLSNGQSIDAEVFRDESGCHCLRLPIAQVSSWSHIPTAVSAIAGRLRPTTVRGVAID
jgi:hypothetical protein